MLILWLSDLDVVDLRLRLRSRLFRLFLPEYLFEPIYRAEPGKHSLYYTTSRKVKINANANPEMAKYVTVRMGIVFPAKDLRAISLLRLPGMVTDTKLNIVYPV